MCCKRTLFQSLFGCPCNCGPRCHVVAPSDPSRVVHRVPAVAAPPPHPQSFCRVCHPAYCSPVTSVQGSALSVGVVVVAARSDPRTHLAHCKCRAQYSSAGGFALYNLPLDREMTSFTTRARQTGPAYKGRPAQMCELSSSYAAV